MKLIKCKLCGNSKIAPGGLPMIVGSWEGSVVKCRKCKRSFKLGIVEFNKLPDLKDVE